MPCTAKKAEILRLDNHTEGRQDTDIVITTQEVIRMIKQVGIKFESLSSEACDMPFSMASGGASIFGITGGVTEAVLRYLSPEKDHTTLENIRYCGIRGKEGFKRATVTLDDRQIDIAVVHGLKNAADLLDEIKKGNAHYDLVEVMACIRGCILGGGQPVPMGPTTRTARMEGIYRTDRLLSIRYTDDNPMIERIWEDIIAGREHELLHRA
ncbi:MAG: iron hydrogenase small subunit [Lachnospiraceae bacterium]|nr:iron hydrogenase small subunit [Lachnospiraceae bacterium]